jgi:ubiquinone biosynthesis protein
LIQKPLPLPQYQAPYIMIIDQTFRNIGRVREIAAILSKYGFEEFVNATPLSSLIPDKRRLSWKKEKETIQYNRWELIRMAAEEMGPTYIKLAQALSNRPDLLPDALIEELQKLQSEVSPIPFEMIEKIIEHELGDTIASTFDEFYKKPLGSASIGQVHRARLADGRNVVVKVQRPGVWKKVQTDLDILKILVSWGQQQLESQGVYGAKDIIEAFERSLMKELDYTTEARFMEQFRSYYKKNKDFYVPKVYKELSTNKILVQEFIRGVKITDVDKLHKWGINTEKLAEKGVNVYLSQIFEHGYFHADPHPGNIIIQEDGTLCLIDFGMVGKLSKHDRFAFAGILIGMARQDPKMMARSFKKLAIESTIEDERAFEVELTDLIDDYATLDISDVDITEVTGKLQNIIRNHQMKMPGSIFIIMRALTILDGIGRTIHPNFKTYEFFKPYGVKIVAQMYSPENLAEDAFETAIQFKEFITSFPVELKEILEKTRKGNLKFDLHNSYDDLMMDKMTRAANRLVLGIVTTGIYLAAAIVMFAYTFYEGPYSLGLLILSLVGFVAAILFTMTLMVGNWWSNR